MIKKNLCSSIQFHFDFHLELQKNIGKYGEVFVCICVSLISPDGRIRKLNPTFKGKRNLEPQSSFSDSTPQERQSRKHTQEDSLTCYRDKHFQGGHLK